MDHTDIISKMNTFMYQLTEIIREWIPKWLPKITDNWWQELVLNNLTPMQRQTVLANQVQNANALDLAALLRVIDRNWFSITGVYFVKNGTRSYVKKMMEVRNTWAHITPGNMNKESILEDLDVIFNMMEIFGASSKDIRRIEKFHMEIESAEVAFENHVTEVSIVNKPESAVNDISVGSPVYLKSDPSVIGAVIGISGMQYKVIINGRFESFYKEQIAPLEEKQSNVLVSLPRVRAALTAYQINNPGSGNLYSLNSARIDFVPYQFRPALKMIKADSPRLLIADDVGVGKTIEAGLILKELEARSSVNSVLIICPRPLVAERKWELEMKRFDEDFIQMDGQMLAEAIYETERDGVWPDRYDKIIIPYSLFNEDVVLGTKSNSKKRRKRTGLSDLDPFPHFDLVIVDEAHNIRNPNTWMYKGVEKFCEIGNADSVVFLTATPLQNSTNDLYTLLHLLRPDVVIDKKIFKTMSAPNLYINHLLRIVRNKEDNWQSEGMNEIRNILGTSWGRDVIQHNPAFERVYDLMGEKEISREQRVELMSKIESLHSFHTMINRTRRQDIEDFCVRRTETIEVEYSPIQRKLHNALMDFERTALTMLHGKRSARFMMCTVMRQASSCIYGLVPLMDDMINRRMNQVQEDGEYFDADYSLDDDEISILYMLKDEVLTLAANLPEEDPKFNEMNRIVEQKQEEDNNRVIIFSSFRHTLKYIRIKLQACGVRVGQIDGSVSDEDRFQLRQRFLLDREDPNAVDVLLFSEVGGEGLDYQFCDTMINYDLPWNPMRIEQRIGRIDRRGQKSDTVRIHNMVSADTIDAEVYYRCLSKIGVFEASIGDCSEILGDISKKITEIMFDPALTEDERQKKLEQLSDNDVRKVQELHQLEQEEKSLYGFDLSSYVQTKEIQDAENKWISPQSIQELINMFLGDFLGGGEYIRGKGELKQMRISADKRKKLLDNLSSIHTVNTNQAYRQWISYLKSNRPIIQVTFDATCAKDNRDAVFLTQMHPLVQQAAAYESQELPCEIGISLHTGEIPLGDYEFLIYVWKYKGLKPDTRLVAVSPNSYVQDNVLELIQTCPEYTYQDAEHVSGWEAMDQLHYAIWQSARSEYQSEVRADCEYRMEQAAHSLNQRSAVIQKTMSQVTDDRVIRMYQSQLEKLRRENERQNKKLGDTIQMADIRTNLQVKGVLHVF